MCWDATEWDGLRKDDLVQECEPVNKGVHDGTHL